MCFRSMLRLIMHRAVSRRSSTSWINVAFKTPLKECTAILQLVQDIQTLSQVAMRGERIYPVRCWQRRLCCCARAARATTRAPRTAACIAAAGLNRPLQPDMPCAAAGCKRAGPACMKTGLPGEKVTLFELKDSLICRCQWFPVQKLLIFM